MGEASCVLPCQFSAFPGTCWQSRPFTSPLLPLFLVSQTLRGDISPDRQKDKGCMQVLSFLMGVQLWHTRGAFFPYTKQPVFNSDSATTSGTALPVQGGTLSFTDCPLTATRDIRPLPHRALSSAHRRNTGYLTAPEPETASSTTNRKAFVTHSWRHTLGFKMQPGPYDTWLDKQRVQRTTETEH